MNLIFVSYFFGIEGMVMSEWAEDKLHASGRIYRRQYLITSIASKCEVKGNVKLIAVPSLSWKDYKWELSECRKHGTRKYLLALTWFPISVSFGRIWDASFSKISKVSAARWSWAFTALPIVLALRLRYPKVKLFATGGATGGHLLALLSQITTKIPIYLEFQDPLLGSEMVRTKSTANWMFKLEEVFITKAIRSVFVTQMAAKSVQQRHPKLADKICFIYPAARNFNLVESVATKLSTDDIEFLHVGTLYGSRNLDNFFKAIDQLKESRFPNIERVKIKNLGDIYLPNRNEYLERKDFELLAPRNRAKALERAMESDVLLLVQHSDSRSQETIPYKTYDYLNLNKRIFGIILNDEISFILNHEAHFLADATSILSIRQKLELFLSQIEKFQNETITNTCFFDPETQFRKIFNDSTRS